MAGIEVPTEGRPEAATDSSILLGVDGNAFSVMATVKRALRQGGATPEYVQEYVKQAMSGDYAHLLAVSVAFLDADGGDSEIAYRNGVND